MPNTKTMNIITYHPEYSLWNTYIKNFIEANEERNLEFYASDWMRPLGYQSFDELDHILQLFIDTVRGSEFGLTQNIKSVYRCNEGKLFHDWKLSLLGLSYLIFNTSSKSTEVRNLQIRMLSKLNIKPL